MCHTIHSILHRKVKPAVLEGGGNLECFSGVKAVVNTKMVFRGTAHKIFGV